MSYNPNYNDQMNSDYGHPSSRNASNLDRQVNDIYGTTTGTTGRIIDDPLHQNANLQAMNNTQMQHQTVNDPNLDYSGAMANQKNVDQSSTIIGSTGTHDQIHDEPIGSIDNHTQAHRGSTGSAYAAAGSFGAIGAPHQYTNQDNTIRDLPSGRQDHIDQTTSAHVATEPDRVQNVGATNDGFNKTAGTHSTGRRPSISDKIKGNLEKLSGKITGDPNKVIHGENVAKGRDF